MRKNKKQNKKGNDFGNKNIKLSNTLFLLVVGSLIALSLISIILLNDFTGYFGVGLNVSAGFVTEVNLNASSTPMYWAGYAGNFFINTSNVSVIKNNTNFGVINHLNLTFDCFGNTGNDIFISPVWYTSLDLLDPFYAATPAEVDAYMGIDSTSSESATNTFKTNITVTIGPYTITSLGAYTHQNGTSDGKDFPLTALKDSSGQIFFATIVNTTANNGYDGNYYNYQVMIPVPANDTNMTYFFFGDPLTDPFGKCVLTNSTVKGKVTAGGIPVANATIYTSGGITYSDIYGNYSLNVSAGNNSIMAIKSGYNTFIGFYTAYLGNVTIYDIDLGALNKTYPEGFYSLEPAPLPAYGNFQYNFSIFFTNLNADAGDIIGCYVNESNCYDNLLPGCKVIFVNKTLASNIVDGNDTLSYKIKNDDIINSTLGGQTDNWIPWRITKCGVYTSLMAPKLEWGVKWRIHVHPIEWTTGDIANAVNGKKAENMFMANTIKTDNQGDIALAVAKYGGTIVEQDCHDNKDNDGDGLVDCDDPDCWGITYSCIAKQSFADTSSYYSPSGSHGTLAAVIPSGDMGTATTSGTTFNTKVEFTMHSMPNGTFKMRFSRWGLAKTATIFVDGLPQIKRVNKYAPGNTQNEGRIKYFLDRNGNPVDSDVLNSSQTYDHRIILRSYIAGGTQISNLDTVINITFNQSSINMSQGYTLTLTFNYLQGSTVYEETMNVVIYFDDKTYNGGVGNRWNSINENESNIWIKGTTWGACNDTKNGDFNFLNCAGNQQYCFDQSSYDCYDPTCNMLSGPLAWNAYTSQWTKGLCAYYKENQTAAMCFDGYNNDWATEDSTLGNQNAGLTLVDCRDSDCNKVINPANATQICHYNIELNCSDGFDNDMYNLKDCQLQAGGTINNAEYDCSGYCRNTLNKTKETGVLCDNNIDDDWDLWYTTTGGPSGYAYNTTGGGMDCAWITNHPDKDCNNTIMSNGKMCQLGRETICNDMFDNDYDNGQGQPDPGWTAAAYNAYFNTTYNLTYVASADYNDYDCQAGAERPPRENLFASWCFDGIDNDLDAYYWSGGTWHLNTSTGKDCADPDCIGVVNPANPNQICLKYEYNATLPFFQNLTSPDKYCSNGFDDDADNYKGWPLGGTDCRDPDCNKKFGVCLACPKDENKTWDACANGIDDNYDMPVSLIDCKDPTCLGQQGDYDSHICAATENNIYLCSDGFDNNANGLIDCADPGCAGIGYCQATETSCNDDMDNDADGMIDCMDSDCYSNPSCGGVTNMTGSYNPPATSSATYGGVLLTWDSKVRKGQNYTVRFQKSSAYNRANLYLGSLTGAGLPVGTGLRAPNFVLTGPSASYFETSAYGQAGSKGQIQILDQVPGNLKSGFNITLSIPTNNTLSYKSFEYYHAIDGSTSTGNTVDVIILDDIPPTVTSVVTEPTNKNSLTYGSSIYVKVIANDTFNGGPYEGTVDRCYYNVTGPNGYSASGYDDIDCIFSFGNIIRDGNYTLKTWARDDTGNIGNVNTTIMMIGLKPKYDPGSFSLTKRFYYSSNIVHLSASFYSDDASSIGNCSVFYSNSNGVTTSAGIVNASFIGDRVTCSGHINSPSSDNMYSLILQVTDSEADETNSSKETFYVCNNRTSNGVGANGEKWTCGLTDLNNDGTLGACTKPILNESIPNISIIPGVTNTDLILGKYFYEPDGEALIYSYTPVSDINVSIANNGSVSIYSIGSWNGTRYIKFYATDDDGNASSNNVTIYVNYLCGNGIINLGEQCDGSDLNSTTCIDKGFVTGTLGCQASCIFDTSGCSMCGNNLINAGEQCDGSDLNSTTCIDKGFVTGTLGCDASCLFNTSSCSMCGNNLINAGEQCDGSDLNSTTCIDKGFASGSLGCDSSCSFNTSSCSMCGNNLIDGSEACDGFNLNGKTCVDQGFVTGSLGCDAGCLFNTSMCSMCGNNLINVGEQCDGSDLNSTTCIDKGFVIGTLGCDASCLFNTSSCSMCGNNLINAGEQCDGSDLNSTTCIDKGFASGSLGCDSSCSFNTSSCSMCGNNLIDGSEACDGPNLNGKTCVDQGFASGTLACQAGCIFDTSSCSMCGNNLINAGEQCDGSDLNSTTCVDKGFVTGTLGCDSSCSFNTSSCSMCGNNLINAGEQCDGSDLNSTTCIDKGFASGTLGCQASCIFNTSSCSMCGNNLINAGEQCDGSDLNSTTCVDKGFVTGTLGCDSSCSFNTSSCSMCGNNLINAGEQCDGSDLNSTTCIDKGFASGTLGCQASCIFNTSSCSMCGNNLINVGEQCDGLNLNGTTCVDRGFVTGTLGCQASCLFNTSSCSMCGNNLIDGSEDCDGSNLNGKTCIDKGFVGGTLGCQASCLFNTSDCLMPNPEGIYSIQPDTLPLAGNYQYNFTIPFFDLTALTGDIIGCYINESNCYDEGLVGCKQIFVNKTLTSDIDHGDEYITYKLRKSDIINSTLGGQTDNWIPWRITRCGIYNSSMASKSEWDMKWRIHVHPIEWTIGDIANTVNGKKAANMYMANTIKTDNQGDIALAVAKYGGTIVEQDCHDNKDNDGDSLVDCSDPDCWGITYSCLAKQSFANESIYYSPSGSHGTLAAVIPSGDMGTATTSGTTFNTKVEYTMHSMPNGTFKMRFSKWGLAKTATIFVDGLPQIKKVNKYAPGNTQNDGRIKYFLDRNGNPVDSDVLNSSQTYDHRIILRSYIAGGTQISNLDTVINVTFADPHSINMSQGYTLTLTFNYLQGSTVYEETMNVVIYFDDKTYNGGVGNRWNSINENESNIWIKGTTWGACNDTKNGDFNFLNCAGNQQYCFDQSSYDCYDPTCNMLSGPSAWNAYTSQWTKGLCAYYKENQTAAMCFDGYNNDWATEATNLGDQNSGLTLVDCRDIDCNKKINPANATQICHYNIELNCSDGFDNDMYNLKDCELQAGGTVNNAEYDCSGYCRKTLNKTVEKGVLCDNNIDDDWDLFYRGGAGPYDYAYNTTGGGMDCAWTTNHPDKDCNMTIMSSGKRCELGREMTCNDMFDNDYDNGQGQPDPGWTAAAYNAYFNTTYNLTYVASADYNDYDCQAGAERPSRENLFASWCFDNIDNDLDAYYWSAGAWHLNSSTGKDCADPDCIGVVNPANPNQVCLLYEYNSSLTFFKNLAEPDKYCKNGFDDDADNSKGWPLGGTDCRDPDCNKKFGICLACPKDENKTWDACANGIDDNYDMPVSMIDCKDPTCLGQQGDYDSHICAATENNIYLCSDGFDNNANGLIDCADPGCAGIGYCQATETSCNDDIDNDRDGLIDCADPDCSSNIICGGSTNMTGSYNPPTTSSATYGGVLVTWNSKVRKGTNYTVRLQKSASYNRANLYLGSLTGAGLPVGTGLRAPNFVLTGPSASYFETSAYGQAGSKGQIQILDQVPGNLKSGFNITLSIPTNNTLSYKSFEYYHAIDGSTSTGNNVDVVILDNIPPTITKVVTEPTNKNSLEYGSSVYVKVVATDPNNGGPYEGTVDRCYYNITGPNGYSASGYDDIDCIFSFGNIIRDGNYTLKTWARDDTGNIGNVNTTIMMIGLKPKYDPGSFSLTKRFYYSSNIVHLSASFYTDDASSVGSCNVFYSNSNGVTTSAGTVSATNVGDKVSCSGQIISPNTDNMYSLLLGLADNEGDKANSSMQTFYVCNNISSHGIGSHGELWSCILRDMNNDGILSACTKPIFNKTIANQSWAKGQKNNNIKLSESFFALDGGNVLYSSTTPANISVTINSSGDVQLDPGSSWTGVEYIVFYGRTEAGNVSSNNVTLAVGDFCGNGAKDSWEECDGTLFGGKTCADYGFNSGQLSCSNSCMIVTTNCNSQGGGAVGGGAGYIGGRPKVKEEKKQPIVEIPAGNIYSSPDKIERTVYYGDVATESLVIFNKRNASAKLTFELQGDILKVASLDSNKSDISPMDSYTLKIKLSGNEAGKFSGKLIIKGDYESSVPIDVIVVKKVNLIPTKIEIVPPLILISALILLLLLYLVLVFILDLFDQLDHFYPIVDYLTLPAKGKDSFLMGNIAGTKKRMYMGLDSFRKPAIISGGAGSGKSIAAKDMAEGLLALGTRVAVFDPKGTWKGIFEKGTDKNMLGAYKKFGMNPKKDPKAFEGDIVEARKSHKGVDVFKDLNPGKIRLFETSKLSPKEFDNYLSEIIKNLSDKKLEHSKSIKYMIIIDDAHTLMPRFGGSGKSVKNIQHAMNKLKDAGIGVTLVSETASDIYGGFSGSFGTKVHFKTRHASDIDKVKGEHGSEYSNELFKKEIGTGLVHNNGWNHGKAFYVEFRPVMHGNPKLKK